MIGLGIGEVRQGVLENPTDNVLNSHVLAAKGDNSIQMQSPRTA